MLKTLDRLSVINRFILLVAVPILSILIISVVNYINLQQMHKQLKQYMWIVYNLLNG